MEIELYKIYKKKNKKMKDWIKLGFYLYYIVLLIGYLGHIK